MRGSVLSWALVAGVMATLVGANARAAGDGVEAEAETAAVRELLEGASGRQEAWTAVPELVVLSSVMEFSQNDATAGYVASAERLSAQEAVDLRNDMSAALGELTGGMVSSFAAARVEDVPAGQTAKVFRRGQIVVGRYRGVQKQAGTLGYGGRTTRSGVITAAAVFLDRDFDLQSAQRRLLRTHELGHALGYNHVETRRSVMNPRVGSAITDFDRRVIRLAFPAPLATSSVARSSSASLPLQN